ADIAISKVEPAGARKQTHDLWQAQVDSDRRRFTSRSGARLATNRSVPNPPMVNREQLYRRPMTTPSCSRAFRDIDSPTAAARSTFSSGMVSAKPSSGGPGRSLIARRRVSHRVGDRASTKCSPKGLDLLLPYRLTP